jgi:hypothetical protein
MMSHIGMSSRLTLIARWYASGSWVAPDRSAVSFPASPAVCHVCPRTLRYSAPHREVIHQESRGAPYWDQQRGGDEIGGRNDPPQDNGHRQEHERDARRLTQHAAAYIPAVLWFLIR